MMIPLKLTWYVVFFFWSDVIFIKFICCLLRTDDTEILDCIENDQEDGFLTILSFQLCLHIIVLKHIWILFQ